MNEQFVGHLIGMGGVYTSLGFLAASVAYTLIKSRNDIKNLNERSQDAILYKTALEQEFKDIFSNQKDNLYDFMKKTQTASHMRKKMVVKNGTVLEIIGRDLDAVIDHKYVFLETMKDWVNKGGTVHYYVFEKHGPKNPKISLKRNDVHRAELINMGRKKQLVVHIANKNRLMDFMKNKLKVQHFALANNPDQMWIERNDPTDQKVGRHYAHDVSYVAKASDLPIYFEGKNIIETIRENSGVESLEKILN